MNEIRADAVIIQEIAIKAPVERIFSALTDPTQRARWWEPKGGLRQATWSLIYAWAAGG